MNKRDLAKFLKSSVENLVKTDDGTTFKYTLDNDLAIYVGWGEGFDEKDETAIHSKKQPTYCVCIKIAENISPFSWEDAYMPWNTLYEEVYDTDSSVSPKEDYENLASIYIDYYKEIRELLDTNDLTF